MPVETGYLARIPVHSDDDSSDVARSVRFLPSISRLAKQGQISLCSSYELRDETRGHPGSRFQGYGCYDYNVFNGVELGSVGTLGPTANIVGPINDGKIDHRERRKQRLREINDSHNRALVRSLGENNDQDAHHIYVANKYGCYCFLTMDFKLLRNVAAQRNSEAIKSLETQVLSPEGFGKIFGINPVSTRLLSFHGASFPVESGTNWPNSKRRGHRQ